MSKQEILQELPNLEPGERQEILERLWELADRDVLNEAKPTPEERAMLDREWEEYQKSPDAGVTWEEAEKRLRERIRG